MKRVSWFVLVAGYLWAGPKPITLEQQNRVLQIQLQGTQAALMVANNSLVEWELLGTKKDPKELSPESLEKLKLAQTRRDTAQKVLNAANQELTRLAEEYRAKNHCPGCDVTPDFRWKQSPAGSVSQ